MSKIETIRRVRNEPALATPRNMKAFEDAHPGRTFADSQGKQMYVEPRRAIAISLSTGEQSSATSGDYWDHERDEPLRDSDGEPMLLATAHTIYKDALTGRML